MRMTDRTEDRQLKETEARVESGAEQPLDWPDAK